jgi:menaquinone-dependent protoporphyrinogen IX oxidase
MGKSNRKGRKKAILILIICIVVIGLGTLGGTLYVTSAGNVKHKSNEIILPGTDSNRNALIIYQPGRSEFGTTIATNLAKGLNESGYEVTINYPGDFLSENLEEYEIVAFGTTVYNGEFSPVLGDYISAIKNIDNSKILIYSTGMMTDNTSELDELSKLLYRKADYMEKFLSNQEESEVKRAYDLGITLGGS